MITFLTFVFILIALLLIMVVLVQRGRGGGLSGAFGSGGGSSSAFGTKTGDVFTTVTVVLFVVFMLMGIWLNYRYRDYTEAGKGTIKTPTPAATNMAPEDISKSIEDITNSVKTPATPTTAEAPKVPETAVPPATQPK